jgi:penicillin-binding protein 1A
LPRRHKSPPPPKRNGRRRIRKLRLFTLLLVLGLLGSASFGFGFMTAVAKEIPRLDPARQVAREENSYILNNDGTRNLAVLRGGENRVIVDSDHIAPVMKQAIVSVEDRRFFEHRGVDARAIVRHPQPVGRAGRFDDHAAVRQEHVREEPALDRAEAP